MGVFAIIVMITMVGIAIVLMLENIANRIENKIDQTNKLLKLFVDAKSVSNS